MPKIVTELPGPKSLEYLAKSKQYEPLCIADQMPVVWAEAHGCLITDVDGNEFLDWCSGVLVTNVGHCHPDYVREVKDQCDHLFNCYDFLTPQRADLAEKIIGVAPDYLDKVFLVTTGTDATEAAMRMARRYNGRWEILAFHGAFHGRTMGAASAGGSQGVKQGYGPMVPGFIHTPFPYCYRCPFGKESCETCGFQCLEFMDWVVSKESCGQLGTVIAEPYQGGAGSIIPPPGWFEKLDAWRKDRGMLFILDEVQSSFGRTGTMFALEHYDITPDLVTLGKGLGSGVPCSAVLGRSEIMDNLPPGSMGSTNGGNPLSSRAAMAAIDIIVRENLVANSARQGEVMMKAFQEMQASCEQLGDVRGQGLVLGLEIVTDRASKTPDKVLARRIVEECWHRGLVLIAPIGMYGNVLRVAPPLVVTDAEVQESLDIFAAALKAACCG
ncbi:MAG TPA: aspartate aminotransferase family protein [Armatimonadota bacterium]|jgi:4-aminobutyrate aminotransferase